MLDNLIIAIPTRGRVGNIITLKSIPESYWENVVLIPHHTERGQHEFPNVLIPPKSVEGIAAVRKWILTTLRIDSDLVLMMDDDMDLCYRPKMSSPRLVTMHSQKNFEDLFYKMIETFIDWFAEGFIHIGISARQGNNRIMTPYRDVGRMMNAYAYDRDALKHAKVEFNRVPVMEDFDLTLQLLRKGYPNRVSYQWCWNQRGSGSQGGCSEYRTAKMQANAARTLKKLHPHFVKVVEKKSASRWKDFQTRVDVNVQWRKAYGGEL